MKYLFIVLCFTLYLGSSAYPFEREKAESVLTENETEIIGWIDLFNDTDSNVSLPRDLNEIVKDIMEKIKESFKDVKGIWEIRFDKIKGKIMTLKDTITDGLKRIKKGIFKIGDEDETVGPRDVTSGKKDDGAADSDSNGKWFMLGLGVCAIAGIMVTIIYHAMKKASLEE